jgi:hypothetical protein
MENIKIIEIETDVLIREEEKCYMPMFNYENSHWCFALPVQTMYFTSLEKAKEHIEKWELKDERRKWECEFKIAKFVNYNPENLTVIFTPLYSGNRTAFLSKLVVRTEDNFENKDGNGVYPVAPFPFWEKDGKYYSQNQNCNTPYTLIPVPNWFTETHLDLTAKRIAKVLNKSYGEGNILRALKSEREDFIKQIILGFQSEN